jgi:hypothetical protein
VKLVVDENPVRRGESVEFSIEAEGESTIFPKIRRIGDYNVTREGMQRLERLEGNRSVTKWVAYYSFTPEENVTIPSYDVIVDGKEERTPPLLLEVQERSKGEDRDFRLFLETEKEKTRVGEPVEVTVRFVQKIDVPVMNVDFVPIKYENFWVKRIVGRKEYRRKEERVIEERFLFFPQIAGELTIGPAEVKIAMAKKMRDAFGYVVRRPQWFSVVSKPVTLHVDPLPEGVKLVGNFKIETRVEPLRAEAGRPVTLTVSVEAEGNIEDFDLPPLRIEGVTVYEEEPKIEQRYLQGVYRGRWVKKYVLVADRSFTIPSMELRFFNPQKGVTEISRSAPVSVEIVGGKPGGEKASGSGVIQKEREESMVWIYLNLAAAFLLGMGVMYLILWLMDRKRKRKERKIPAAGSESQMLQRLMPYIAESKEAAQMAENLYASIFEGKAVKVDRKAFERLIEKLRIEN